MSPTPQSDRRFWIGFALRFCALIALVMLAAYWASVIKDMLGIQVMPHNEALMHKMILSGLLAYIVLTAIPFVPGAEIGVTLLTVFGAQMAPLIYLATILSLLLAYTVGRFVPLRTTASALRRLHLAKMADLMERLDQTPRKERPEMMLELVEKKPLKHLARHRYVALALLINFPGNVIIGGGGGLSLMAGLSGVFSAPLFVLTIAIAVSPVPLMIFLTGV